MSEYHHHHISGKNLFITIAQLVGGLLSGSLALLSDAMHNFSDVFTLIIAYWANRLSARPNTQTKTFGYKRAEILATLFNASLLIGIGLFLIIEAIDRFLNPEVIDSIWVISLGAFSIILNSLSVFLIKDDAHHIHIWRLDDHRVHFEAHLNFKDNISITESNQIIEIINQRLLDDFEIYHTTFQSEYNCCENKDVIKQL